MLEAGWPLVVEPQARKYKPASIVEAQFSMPFGAALAVIHRAAGLDQFNDENLRSGEMRQMMGKVVMTKDQRLEQNFPAEWPAFAVIELDDGRRLEKFIAYPKGDPQNLLTWDELIAKFKSLAGRKDADRIVQAVRNGASPAALPSLCVGARSSR